MPARHELVPALTDLAGRDYLSPTIAGLLAPDLLQRLLPFAALPDRASYLEQAFETGWTDHCAAEPNRCHAGDMLSQSFLSLWRNTRRPWLPALVIGGARVEDGRRILTSNISLAGAVDGEDFFDLDKHDISLATAIDNGARFPFVSPGGTLGYTDRNHKWTTSGHVVDGGYFEAAGIETLRELVSSVVARHPMTVSKSYLLCCRTIRSVKRLIRLRHANSPMIYSIPLWGYIRVAPRTDHTCVTFY